MANRSKRNDRDDRDDFDNAVARGIHGGHLSRGSMGNRGALGAGYIDRTNLSAGNVIGGGNSAGFGTGGNWYTTDPSYDGYSGTMGDETDLAGYGRATPMGRVARALHEGNHAGRGSKNYRRSDSRIEEDVHEALLRDPHVDATDIDLRVDSGVVILYGEVATRAERRRAEELVEHCAGVRDVQNDIRARQPLPANAAQPSRAMPTEREVTKRPQTDLSTDEPQPRNASSTAPTRSTTARNSARR